MRITLIVLVVACLALAFGPWLLSLPVKLFANVVLKYRVRKFDLEHVMCPACGYKGDKRSDFRSVQLQFRRTTGTEKAAIECTCYRCGAVALKPLYTPADKWLPNLSIEEFKARKEGVSG